MKITKDGFIYKIVNDKAIKIHMDELFPLFILNEDGSERLIENDSDLRYALDNNLPIAIEVGRVETNDAKEILTNNGYYTDNLWTIHDVMDKFDCNEEQAYKVLDSALQNGAMVAEIHFTISEICSDKNYLEKE